MDTNTQQTKQELSLPVFQKALGFVSAPAFESQHILSIRFAGQNAPETVTGKQEDLISIVDDLSWSSIQALIAKKQGIKPFVIPHQHQIIEHHITAATEYNTIPFESYRRIQPEQAIKHTKTITHNQLKLKQNALHLGFHTRCVCEETGISFAVALPSPIETSMTLLHPFAFHNNVVTFIKKYQRHGIPLAQLDSSALAGMLITLLKHKGFIAYCKDYAKANERLREVNKKTLCYVLTYFYRAQPRYNLPQIDLLEQGNPTSQLLSFLSICRGTDETIQTHHIQTSKTTGIKAKVYQTQQDKESALLREDIKSCKYILERLQKQTAASIPMYEQFINRVNKLAVLTEETKQQLITDIYSAYGENEDTKALHLIIKSNDTSAIQKDLLTFSLEIEQEIKQHQQTKQREKIDFAKLMGYKKD